MNENLEKCCEEKAMSLENCETGGCGGQIDEPSINEVRNYEPVANCCDKEVYVFRPLKIEKLNFGYLITIGCHTFAIETKERLAKLVSDYILDPSTTEKKWWETKTV